MGRDVQVRLGAIPGDSLARIIQGGALISETEARSARSARSAKHILGPGTVEVKAKATRVKISVSYLYKFTFFIMIESY